MAPPFIQNVPMIACLAAGIKHHNRTSPTKWYKTWTFLMGKIIEINGYMVDIFMDCPAMFDYQRDPGRVTTVTTQFRPLPCCRHRGHKRRDLAHPLENLLQGSSNSFQGGSPRTEHRWTSVKPRMALEVHPSQICCDCSDDICYKLLQ